MLKALYNYAKSHPDIIQLRGCGPCKIACVIDLTSDGSYLGVRTISKNEREIICPRRGTRTSAPIAHPVADTAVIAIGVESDKELSSKQVERLFAQRSMFIGYFEDGKADVPEFEAVLVALRNDDTMNVIRQDFMNSGCKPSEVVSFSVGGINLWEMSNVLDWWSNNCPDQSMDETAIDIVTGEICKPARLYKQMHGRCIIGGQSSGVALISFDNSAFVSYGLIGKQNLNCPMSPKTADMIMDAITKLGNEAPAIGNTRMVHWYAGSSEVEDDFDILSIAIDGFKNIESDDVNENAKNDKADRLIESVFKGEVPPSLAGTKYHMICMQPSAARMIIRSYETGGYGDLRANIIKWFEDLCVVSGNGRVYDNYLKLYRMLYGLLLRGEENAKTGKLAPIEPFITNILDACFQGRPVPDIAGYRALAGFKSGIYNDDSDSNQHRRISWLKLWLNRNSNQKGRGNMPEIKAEIDRGNNYPPYVCGRLMALYDMTQRKAANLNSSVVSKFFTSCCNGPAMVLGRLQAMSVHHLENIKSNRVRYVLQQRLGDAWSLIGSKIPARLDAKEQAYFACGYWQEMAALKNEFDNGSDTKKEDN